MNEDKTMCWEPSLDKVLSNAIIEFVYAVEER